MAYCQVPLALLTEILELPLEERGLMANCTRSQKNGSRSLANRITRHKTGEDRQNSVC